MPKGIVKEYYATGCPICKEAMEEIKKLKKRGIKVKRINCLKSPGKCLDVRNYPTFEVEFKGKKKVIEGFASAEDIEKELNNCEKDG